MVKRVAVIGSGLAGLASTIRLARMGFRVELFEQTERPGGKVNEYIREEFRFDTGPSLLTMPFVIDELFSFAGLDRRDYLCFEKMDPVCRYFFSDGSRLDALNDRSGMEEQIARIAPDEVVNYRNYISYSEKLYNIAGEAFLFNPIHEVKKLLNLKMFRLFLQIYKIDAFRSMHDANRSFFNDARLVQLFDRYATYNGSDPFRAPATLNTIPFVEHELNAYYIKGGMYRFVEALQSVADKSGVTSHFGTPILEIVHKDNTVQGVQAADRFYEADYVVCNTDVISAHRSLIKGKPEIKEKYDRLEPSLAGMVFMWGIDDQHDELAHHNILFSDDYRLEFRQIFEEKRPAEDPTVYVAITSKSDPAHAPAASENWFVLVNMPYLSPGQDWEAFTNQTRNAVFKRLQQKGIDIKDKIRFEHVWTPETFEQSYNAYKGSIYGIASNNRFSAFKRPANRSRDIRGLYFAGGSAHPGGGIPLVLLSAKFVADLIGEKEGIRQQSERPFHLK